MTASYLLPIFIFGIIIIFFSKYLPSFSLKKPVAYSMILILILLLGVISFQNLPLELMPDVSSGNVTIYIDVRGGMPPPEIERLISKPVEEAMSTVSKMRNITSISKKNKSITTIEFEPGINMNLATMEVREKFLRIKSKLPKDIERPVIARYEESDAPIVIAALTSSEKTPEEMRTLVETKLKDKLMRVEGVANVDIGGGRERKIIVELDKYKIASLKISIRKVVSILEQNNLNIQVGEIYRQNFSDAIRIMGAFRSVKEIENIAIDINEKGTAIKLSDIGCVKDSFLEAESYARFNSKQSVTIYIQKESMTNTVKVASNIGKVLDNFKKTLDKSTELLIVSDQSSAIKSSIASVEMTILYGIILIIIILTTFLSKQKFTRIFARITLAILLLNLVIFYIFGIPLDSSRFFILGILLLTIIVGIIWCKDIFTSFVVAFSIPISVCITLTFMYFEKMTLNVISLSGLILGIGLLVDNSIVVLENFEQMRHKLPDKNISEQLKLAAIEMASPMIGGTLTTVVVFLPFFLLQKQTQLLYSGIAFTVITSLFASLFCALSLVPWTASLLLKYYDKKEDIKPSQNPLSFVKLCRNLNMSLRGATATWKSRREMRLTRFARNDKMLTSNGYETNLKSNTTKIIKKFLIISAISLAFACLVFCFYSLLKLPFDVSIYIASVIIVLIFGLCMFKFYDSALSWCIKKRKFIICFIVVLCVSAMAIFILRLPKDFMASSEQNEFTIFIELASGVKLEISNEIVKTVENKINAMKDIKSIIKNLSSRVEGWSSKIYVTLVPRSDRKYSTQNVIDIFRKRLKNIGERYETFIHFSEPQNGKEIIIEIYGDDYENLSKLAMTIASNMESVKGFNDIKVRYRPGQPELVVNLDQRKIAMFGLDNKEIAETLHAEIRGLRAASFYDKSEEIETIVRLDPKQCKTLDDFSTLFFITPNNLVVSPDSISNLTFDISPSEIWHRNKSRMIQVSANIITSLDKAATNCKDLIKKVQFPEGYYADIGGDYEDMKESNKSFWYAMGITILLIFIVLASIFESYTQPFIIMITVLLSLIGAVAALSLTTTTVTLGVLIGILMLCGIVVNNGIMLVDRINIIKLKNSNQDIIPTIIQAANERKRPIFMTTATTVLGLLPMALDKSDAAVLWSPMATTVIGGLITSTVLTLFVLPCFYILILSIQIQLSKLNKKIF